MGFVQVVFTTSVIDRVERIYQTPDTQHPVPQEYGNRFRPYGHQRIQRHVRVVEIWLFRHWQSSLSAR
jgi:hypothetical protein